MGRVPCCEKNNGLKKGPWTPEEDVKLINYIQIHGPGKWRSLPKNAGLQRCGKSCRLRWTNYLRPDIKRGRFSLEEEDIIIQLHSIMGNKWSAIAARLPGRTDNEIKNYWNTHIRKRLLRMGVDPVTHAPRLDLLDMPSVLRSVLGNPSLNMQGLLGAQILMNQGLLKLAASASLLPIKNDENPNLASQNYVQSHVTPPLDLTQFQMPMEGFSGSMEKLSCSRSPPLGEENLSLTFIKDSVGIMYINEQHSSLYEQLFEVELNQNQCDKKKLVLQQNQVDLLGNYPALVHSLNNANQNMHVSSPNQLNSSSTYVKSGTEEERESYCSDLFEFHIPESLDIPDIFCNVPQSN